MIASEQQAPSLDKWAEIALREDWVGEWISSAMFPCELAFLLTVFERHGVKRIFESGRHEGYSTARLGAYTEHEGAEVYSIDFESRPDVAERARQRLRKYPAVHLVKGDTFRLLGDVVQSHPGAPSALVVDGPKLFGAISVVFAAAAFPWIRVFAMHNLDPASDAGVFFTRVAGRPRFYEDEHLAPHSTFARLRAQEVEQLPAKAKRPLDRSSLAVLALDDEVRGRLLWTADRRFGRHQPAILYWRWRLAHRLFRRGS